MLDLFTRRGLHTSPASSDECDTSKRGELMIPCDVKDEGPLYGAVAVRSLVSYPHRHVIQRLWRPLNA